MGTGNKNFFKGTSGDNMPKLNAYKDFGKEIESKSVKYYIEQFVKGYIKWQQLKSILNEKDDFLRKDKYFYDILVRSFDFANQLRLLDVGRNEINDLLTWTRVVINSDIFYFDIREKVEFKEILFLLLNTKTIDGELIKIIKNKLKVILI